MAMAIQVTRCTSDLMVKPAVGLPVVEIATVVAALAMAVWPISSSSILTETAFLKITGKMKKYDPLGSVLDHFFYRCEFVRMLNKLMCGSVCR